ncbi:MAG: AtpZ/AtpI family protein [Aliidongia sp.]
MKDTDSKDSPDQLEARIAEARRRQQGPEAKPKVTDSLSGNFMGAAFRIGVELVAALIVSVGFGWLLDRWLGTRPWLMVAFFFLGSAAGMMNVYRVANGMGLAAGFKRPGGEGRNGSDDA